MKELTTKEHILHFMQSGYMRLSKYDLKFVHNLLGIINQNKPLTTNQVALVDKLLEKYHRQFEKHKMDKVFIAGLPWTTAIKTSDPYYTEAYIAIEDGMIYFRSPYSKNFVNSFNAASENPFKWSRDDKRYYAPYTTTNLRFVVKKASNFYPIVNYCPIVSDLLNTIKEYDGAKFWTPTLAKVNGRFMIAAINEFVNEATKDIDLNDDIKTLSKLAEYAVNVDPDLINNDKKLSFASSYNALVDYLQTDTLIEWLIELECDLAVLEGYGLDASCRKSLSERLRKAGISVASKPPKLITNLSANSPVNEIPLSPKYPVRIEFSTINSLLNLSDNKVKAKKVILMTNSTPINIK